MNVPAPVAPPPTFPARNAPARRESQLFAWLCRLATWFSVILLIVLLGAVSEKAFGWLDWQFLTSFDSSLRPKQAGILAGIFGTGWVILLTILFSVPVGVGAAIYLEEYATDNWLTRLIRVNLANLAGVPSIVYGILGFTLFVRMFGIFQPNGPYERWTGHSFGGFFYSDQFSSYLIPIPFGPVVLSGALTLSLLILPVIIISSQEALRAIPASLRHASLALGATRWQTIRNQVLPAAVPGIMTGVILAISRAIGETAPLILLGVATFVNFAPGNIHNVSSVIEHPEGLIKIPFDRFTTIPIQIYNWIQQAKGDFKHVAAAGIVVLLVLLLILNGLAVLIRNRSGRHLRW